MGSDVTDTRRYVFASIAPCGHAQAVYADVLQSDGSRWRDEIMADLRAGLTVQRMPASDFQIKYGKTMLCDCADERSSHPNPQTAAIQPERALEDSTRTTLPDPQPAAIQTQNCTHERLHPDGICRKCGEDRRGI